MSLQRPAHDVFRDLHSASISRRLQAWSRDRLLLAIFICQLLFFSALVGLAWKVGSHRLNVASGVQHSALPLHDDPVSAARQHAQRTHDPLVAGDQQSLAAGGGGAAAAEAAQQQHRQQQLALQQASAAEDLSTLVLYIFSPTDPEYLNNLLYFIRDGIQANDGCEYVIVVNQAMGEEMASFSAMAHMAGSLPPNARYVTHRNECYDWGTLGWLLLQKKVDTARYRYILFINSSVRGPYLPAYWPKSVHWTRIFTDRITDRTKLVGPTISCEGIQPVGMPERKNPHVQSFVVATDQVGLGLLLKDGNVFRCYDHIHLTMFHSELGASKAVLDAGYNIDTLMMRYQGVNWQDKSQWNCNANESPYKESHYDGINVDPLEVLFVKVKEPLLQLRYSASLKAEKYDQWSANAAAAAAALRPQQRNVSTNAFQALPADFRPVVLTAEGRSATGQCFDVPYYKQMSPELMMLEDRIAMQHFAAKGQFEGRHFRFVTCPA